MFAEPGIELSSWSGDEGKRKKGEGGRKGQESCRGRQAFERYSNCSCSDSKIEHDY